MTIRYFNKILFGVALTFSSIHATDLSDIENYIPGSALSYNHRGEVVDPMLKSFNLSMPRGLEQYGAYYEAYKSYTTLQPMQTNPIDPLDGSFEDFLNLKD